MFRWYSRAVKCYVFLSDVSTKSFQHIEYWESTFRKSRWFTRGWTLQELIAPQSVEFFCSNGNRLGDKTSLERQIHEITRIPVSAFRGISLAEFSIDDRILWAAKRETKREEDKVYSLFGIFDIHMPLIYGEGTKNALSRLMEECQKRERHDQRDQMLVISPVAASLFEQPSDARLDPNDSGRTVGSQVYPLAPDSSGELVERISQANVEEVIETRTLTATNPVEKSIGLVIKGLKRALPERPPGFKPSEDCRLVLPSDTPLEDLPMILSAQGKF
jgi:hypothetical protein